MSLYVDNMFQNYSASNIFLFITIKDLTVQINFTSISKKYTIYSKVKGGDWHKIVFDITKLETTDKPSLDDIRSIPEKCDLPKFIKSFEGKNLFAE